MSDEIVSFQFVANLVAGVDNFVGNFGPGVETILFCSTSTAAIEIFFGQPASATAGFVVAGNPTVVILRRADFGNMLDQDIHAFIAAAAHPLYLLVAKRG